MKTIYSFLVILAMSVSCFAQTPKSTTRAIQSNEEVFKFLEDFNKNEINTYIGEPASSLYYRLKNSPFNIQHMSTIPSNIWREGDGKNYVLGVILYNMPIQEIEKNAEAITVYIWLNIDKHFIEEWKFWKDLPKKNWMEGILNQTKNYYVTDFQFKKMRIGE